MAAFLVARDERLRIHLRDSAARNAGAETANGNQAIVLLNHCRNPHFQLHCFQARCKPDML